MGFTAELTILLLVINYSLLLARLLQIEILSIERSNHDLLKPCTAVRLICVAGEEPEDAGVGDTSILCEPEAGRVHLFRQPCQADDENDLGIYQGPNCLPRTYLDNPNTKIPKSVSVLKPRATFNTRLGFSNNFLTRHIFVTETFFMGIKLN